MDLDGAELMSHYSYLRGVCRKIVRDPETARDMVQNTFLAALSAPQDRAALTCSLRTWLHRIAVNECLDYLRRQARRIQPVDADLTVVPDTAPGIHAQLEARERVEALLAPLSERERRLVVMHAVDGYSTRDLAEFGRAPANTVKVQLWRARQRAAQQARNPSVRPHV